MSGFASVHCRGSRHFISLRRRRVRDAVDLSLEVRKIWSSGSGIIITLLIVVLSTSEE